MPVADLIQLRRDTAANWTSTNPTLSAGEFGFETDTGLLKIGTGAVAWTSLAYDAAKLPAAFTAGSVLFVGATDVISEDNAGISFNSTTDTLTVGAIIVSAGTATRAPLKLTSGTSLTTPAAGAIEYDGSSIYFTTTLDRRSLNLANGIISSDTAVSNTTAETVVYTEPISANEFKVARVVKVRILGIFGTANASDTFTARLKVGGTTVDTVVSTGKNVTNGGFDTEFMFTIRSIGATGTIQGHVRALFDNDPFTQANTSTTTIDTTAADDITLTIQWSSASASNSVTVKQAWTEFIG